MTKQNDNEVIKLRASHIQRICMALLEVPEEGKPLPKDYEQQFHVTPEVANIIAAMLIGQALARGANYIAGISNNIGAGVAFWQKLVEAQHIQAKLGAAEAMMRDQTQRGVKHTKSGLAVVGG